MRSKQRDGSVSLSKAQICVVPNAFYVHVIVLAKWLVWFLFVFSPFPFDDYRLLLDGLYKCSKIYLTTDLSQQTSNEDKILTYNRIQANSTYTVNALSSIAHRINQEALKIDVKPTVSLPLTRLNTSRTECLENV